MTVGSEVTLREIVIITDKMNTETILAGTKGIVKRIGEHTAALLIGNTLYPDIPMQSVECVKGRAY